MSHHPHLSRLRALLADGPVGSEGAVFVSCGWLDPEDVEALCVAFEFSHKVLRLPGVQALPPVTVRPLATTDFVHPWGVLVFVPRDRDTTPFPLAGRLVDAESLPRASPEEIARHLGAAHGEDV